ncbi:MAG: DUF2723 domain-containing protein [Chloroflexota bacterium]
MNLPTFPADVALGQRLIGRGKAAPAVQSRVLTTAVAFMLPFLLYVNTLAPTIYNLDSAELTTAAASRGIVRATGYPLYLLLGRIWVWLPVGDVGYRLNLFSAFNGALTIALAECILRRLPVGPWARLGALGLLAASPYFWAMSLVAEVYTLHTALMAGVILLCLRWRERPTTGRLVTAVFLASLSLGNHAASVLLAPACLWLVFTVRGRQALRPRTLALCVAAVLAGFSIYLYLPLLHAGAPAFNYAGSYNAAGIFVPVNLHTPAGLWWLVSGRAFAGQMFAYRGLDLWREGMNFFGQLWAAFFAVGLGPGILGLVQTWRRDWRLGGFLAMLFLVNAVFYINYRVIDKNTMFLPTYVIWALWLGVGYQALFDWMKAAGQTPTWLARGMVAGLVIFVVAWNWPLVDLSGDYSARERGEAILETVKPDALVLGWWDTVPVVEYLQIVEGRRPDVVAINRFLISGDDMELLVAEQIQQRPVYINNPPANLLRSFNAVPTGPVYELQERTPRRG